MPPTPDRPVPAGAPLDRRRASALVAGAIVLTGLNLRTAVNSVGPVLQELERGLGISSGAAGLITTMPLLCFALIGFAGPPLGARFRDSHVLAAALAAMTAGLLLRAVAGSLWLFLLGTVAAMVGGALGNVLLPGLVKRWFPERTGLLIGAYSTAMAAGGAVAAVVTARVAEAVGAPDGWRWALGCWAALALVAVVPWLAVRAHPGSGARAVAAVRMRSLVSSRLVWALSVFFGLQAMQAYIIIGWSVQYLRDEGMSAADASLLLGVNSVVVIGVNAVAAVLTVRQSLQRPLLLFFVACYVGGWTGLVVSPRAGALAWMVLLAVGMGTFAMILTMMGMRARTPESTNALSTLTQGWGYLIAAAGPLLVGISRGLTGGYSGMFVLVYLSLAGLAVSGWLVCRDRYVDDEVPALAGAVATAGLEPPVVTPPR